MGFNTVRVGAKCHRKRLCGELVVSIRDLNWSLISLSQWTVFALKEFSEGDHEDSE